MRALALLFLLVSITPVVATLYTHELKSADGTYFIPVQSSSLIKGYAYYHEYANGSLQKLESIPSDNSTSNVYVKNVESGAFELKFTSEVGSDLVTGYYTTSNCQTTTCTWEPLLYNILTNSQLVVYKYEQYYKLEKQVEDCGDGLCEASKGENCGSCVADCACGAGESCSNNNCVVNPSFFCGNHVCEQGYRENCASCPIDCACSGCCIGGSCLQPVCGDNQCVQGCEDYNSCPSDCYAQSSYIPTVCGNGLCESNETCSNCGEDCGQCLVEQQKVYNNAYNHTCTIFNSNGSAAYRARVTFKKVFDSSNRSFMISVDCPYADGKPLTSENCAKSFCGRGYYCGFGSGGEGTYYHDTIRLIDGEHVVCVWSSSPENYKWEVKLELFSLSENSCGDNFCDSSIGEDCRSCVRDCGACALKTGRTVTVDMEEQGDSASISFSPTVGALILNLTAKNSDAYHYADVFVIVNNNSRTASSLLLPGEIRNFFIEVKPQELVSGLNTIQAIVSSQGSKVFGQAKLFYENEKPLIINYSEKVVLNESYGAEIFLSDYYDGVKADFKLKQVLVKLEASRALVENALEQVNKLPSNNSWRVFAVALKDFDVKARELEGFVRGKIGNAENSDLIFVKENLVSLVTDLRNVIDEMFARFKA